MIQRKVQYSNFWLHFFVKITVPNYISRLIEPPRAPPFRNTILAAHEDFVVRDIEVQLGC